MVELLKMYIHGIEITREPIDENKNELLTIKGIGYDFH
jgi:hypothetical protein